MQFLRRTVPAFLLAPPRANDEYSSSTLLGEDELVEKGRQVNQREDCILLRAKGYLER